MFVLGDEYVFVVVGWNVDIGIDCLVVIVECWEDVFGIVVGSGVKDMVFGFG